jgi:hypothetical protein
MAVTRMSLRDRHGFIEACRFEEVERNHLPIAVMLSSLKAPG